MPPRSWSSGGAQLLELADGLDLALCATGTHPWSPWQEQRIIDTPHYRRNDEVLRYVVWRNNTFGLHVHVGIKGADRAILVTNALRGVPSRAARLLGQLAVRRGRLHVPALGADGDLHAHVPALRRAGRLPRLGRVRGLRPLPLPHGVDHRAHAALVERPPAPRVPHGRDADLRRPARARRVAGARRVHVCADRADRTRDRRGRGAAGPPAPPDRGEPLARDPPRALRRADRPAERRRHAGARADRAAPRVDDAGGRGARRRVVPHRPGRDARRAADRQARGRADAWRRSTPRRCWKPSVSEPEDEEQLAQRAGRGAPAACASRTSSSRR